MAIELNRAISPPLIITEAEIDEAMTRITRATDDAYAELGGRH